MLARRNDGLGSGAGVRRTVGLGMSWKDIDGEEVEICRLSIICEGLSSHSYGSSSSGRISTDCFGFFIVGALTVSNTQSSSSSSWSCAT